MDEVDYAGGDTVDFHGVKMNWAGDMTGAEMMAQIAKAYVPSLIHRNTNWIFHAGKPVHLLREPDGTVWVMQEYTKAVDPSLTTENLQQVGSKLKNLPKGWKFETKVLTDNLSLDTGSRRRLGRHPSRRTWQSPTRAAATARTPVPTTCRNPRGEAVTPRRERQVTSAEGRSNDRVSPRQRRRGRCACR